MSVDEQCQIPSLKNRPQPREIDRQRYKDRNLVERFWFKVKPYRRAATRYEKTARNLLTRNRASEGEDRRTEPAPTRDQSAGLPVGGGSVRRSGLSQWRGPI